MGELLRLSMLALAPWLTQAEPETVPGRQDPSTIESDVVVYGGTSAAIISAVRLARLGRSVTVVSPDVHLGGMSSNGLGWTDSGRKEVIGGLAAEFYERVFDHYQKDEAWRWQARDEYGNRGQGTVAMDGATGTMWIFEPHVAEQVFEDLVDMPSIRLERGTRLDRSGAGVVLESGAIRAISDEHGTRYVADVFIDATYEGDLMAAAGVSYHVGREPNDTYGESWNGVQPDARHHTHHFGVVEEPVDPWTVPGDPESGVIPKVTTEPLAATGSGDDKVQAYCFRMCLTDHPDNRVPFTEPEGYDPRHYEIVARVFEAGWRDELPPFSPIPNRKTDTNNHGPVSFDNIGANYAYPEASYAERRAIVLEHERYQRGLLWFMRTDPRVPSGVRAQMERWGLAGDEFAENGHWPYQLYVREARRMIGDVVLTEHHVMGRECAERPVGMGSYVMDSHNVQRYVTTTGAVENEGDVGVRPPAPYRIPYGVLVPKKNECSNLLVPVCVSSSHIAFGSVRMEPVFMVLGDSAAMAAHLAIEGECSVQDVPYTKLVAMMQKAGQVLELPEALRTEIAAQAKERERHSVPIEELEGIVVDDAQAVLEGAWQRSTSSTKYVGAGYLHDRDTRSGTMSATFTPEALPPGRYEVRVGFPHGGNRSTTVPIDVTLDGGDVERVIIDQRGQPEIDGLFVSLGVFDVVDGVSVRVTNEGTDGYVVADAVQFLPVRD